MEVHLRFWESRQMGEEPEKTALQNAEGKAEQAEQETVTAQAEDLQIMIWTVLREVPVQFPATHLIQIPLSTVAVEAAAL